MLPEPGRGMEEHSGNFNGEREYKKVPRRSHIAEEHSSWSEKCTRRGPTANPILQKKVSVELTQTEKQKDKRMKKIEESLRDSWGNIKQSNVHITGAPEERERKEQKI